MTSFHPSSLGDGGWNLPIEDLPPVGVRVVVTRESGEQAIGRLDYPKDGSFRSQSYLEWMDDNDRFLSVRFDKVQSWAYGTAKIF